MDVLSSFVSTLRQCARLARFAFDVLMPPRPTERLLRGLSDDALLPHFNPVRERATGITALASYKEPLVHAAILETKFHGNKRSAQLLAHLLNLYIGTFELSNPEKSPFPPVFIPLPLSRERKKARGYNQVERVVRYAAEMMPGLEIAPTLLARTRDTAPQTSLSGAERRRNMRDAFVVAGTIDSRRTYIVIDDVATTGSTLRAAIRALTNAGAVHVVAVAFARSAASVAGTRI